MNTIIANFKTSKILKVLPGDNYFYISYFQEKDDKAEDVKTFISDILAIYIVIDFDGTPRTIVSFPSNNGIVYRVATSKNIGNYVKYAAKYREYQADNMNGILSFAEYKHKILEGTLYADKVNI